MGEEALKTSDQLFLSSLEGDYEDETGWDAIRELQIRNSDEVFELALAYVRSDIPKHLAHLRDEDPLVVNSAAWALAHLGDERAVTGFIEMRHCPDPEVRWAVAYGMPGERPESIGTLIELMEDNNDEVRNWATFGLGMARIEDESSQLGCVDSSEIREAFRKRLSDPFDEARDEAIWGLAQRRDPAALQLLLKRLESERWVADDEMAASEILGLTHNTPVEDLRGGLRNLIDRQTSEDHRTSASANVRI